MDRQQVPAIISDLSQQERSVLRQRQEVLTEALSHLGQAAMNTGKEEKAFALLSLIREVTGQNIAIGAEFQLYYDPRPEVLSPESSEVARSKALRARSIQGINVTIGQDVNAYQDYGQDIGFKQEHKLARLGRPLTEQEENMLWVRLRSQYCNPPGGKVRIFWDLSTHVINGKDYNFGEKVELISDPVDEVVLRQYFDEAIENGLVMSSNLHFGAIECLKHNGKIRTIAVLSREMAEKGFRFPELRQIASDQLIDAVLYSVITNAPIVH